MVKPVSLRTILLIVGSATTLGVMLLMAWSLSHLSSQTLSKIIGQNLVALADQAQNKIERTALERRQDLSAIASDLEGVPPAGSAKTRLDAGLKAHPEFAWIALADNHGTLLAKAGDASQEYIETAVRLTLQPSPLKSAPLLLQVQQRRELVVTVRVVGPAERHLIAGLGDGWIARAERDLQEGMASHPGVSVRLLTNKDGKLQELGEPDEQILHLARRAYASPTLWTGEAEQPGANGKMAALSSEVRTGASEHEAFHVLVSQPAHIALQPLATLRNTALACLVFFAIHAVAVHLILSSMFAEPFIKLSKAADEVRTTGQSDIPDLRQFAEAKLLSHSLQSLVHQLKGREQSLLELGASLERQVEERTRDLEQKNTLLAEATAKAEVATKAKGRLLAMASHDLRQPLQALSLFSRALQRRLTTLDTKELASQIDQSVAALTSMFDELLHVARLDAGQVTRTLVPVDLRSLMERLGGEVAHQCEQKGLRFNFFAPRTYVLSDPALLEIVLRNLLSNALKFTKTGGIVLTARSRGDRMAIEVYDTGPGIAPSRTSLIFEEFERSGDHARGPNEGLGLGLSIVKRHAALIGAAVDVRSCLGHGSRFSVSLPKCDRASHALVQSEPNVKHSGCVAGLKVLVLEDCFELRHALSLDLEDRGATVSAFSSPDAASQALERGLSIDVAILDYDLGRGDTGLAFLERQGQRANFPALIVTGSTDGKTLARIEHSGLAYMAKPADADALAAAAESLARSNFKHSALAVGA